MRIMFWLPFLCVFLFLGAGSASALQTFHGSYLSEPEGVHYDFDGEGNLTVYIPPVRNFDLGELPPRVKELLEKKGVHNPDASWTAKATPDFFVEKELPSDVPMVALDGEEFPVFSTVQFQDNDLAQEGTKRPSELDVRYLDPSSQI